MGIIKGSYDYILQREEYTIEKKEVKKQMETISAVYWLSATAIYLAKLYYKPMGYKLDYVACGRCGICNNISNNGKQKSNKIIYKIV